MSKKIRNTITIYDATDSTYTLVMIPGKTTYVYDNTGNKINKDDNLGKYTFQLYENGGFINPSNIEVEWTTPLVGSCISGTSKEKIFVPQIVDRYSEECSDNKVTLKVKINEQTLVQTQTISIVKAVKDGEDGQDGVSSKVVNLVASSLVVKYDKEGVPSINRVDITAYSQNLSSKVPRWSALTDKGEIIIEELDTSHGVLFSDETTSENPKLGVPHDVYFWNSPVVGIKVTMDGVSDVISLTKLKDGTAGEQGRTYRNLGMWLYSEKYGADKKYIDLVRYKGDVYECLRENVGKKPTNENYWRLFIEKGEPGPILDWVKDWDSHKTLVGDDYIISPKIFLGQNGNPTGEASLTGIAIGRDVYGQTNGTIGIVGYNDNKHTFEMLTDGSAYFGVDPNRRFVINYDGSISTPDLTADTIKGGTLALGGKWRKTDANGNVIIDVVGNDGIRGQSNGVLKVFDENTEMYVWDADLGEYRWKTYKEINADSNAIVTVDTKGIKMTKGVIEGNGMLLDVTDGHFQIGKEIVEGREKYRLAYNHSTKKLTLEPDILNITTSGEFNVSDGKGAELSFKNGIMVQKAYNYEFNSGRANDSGVVEGWRFRLGANNTDNYALRFDNSGLNINPTNLKVNATGNVLIGTGDVNYLKFTGSSNTLELKSGNVLLKGGDNWQFRLGHDDSNYSLNYTSSGSLNIKPKNVDIAFGGRFKVANTDGTAKFEITSAGKLNMTGDNINIQNNGGTFNVKDDGTFNFQLGGKTSDAADKYYLKFASRGNLDIKARSLNFQLEGKDTDVASHFKITANNITLGVTDAKNYADAQIKISADSISSTVNGQINTLDGKISANTSKITQTANEIRSEVSASVSSLNGKISSNSSSISQNASNINLKVSKNDVINQINVSSESIDIDANKINLSSGFIVTGKTLTGVEGSIIETETLVVDKIKRSRDTSVYMEIDSGYSDVTTHRLDHTPCQIYDDVDGITIKAYGKSGIRISMNGYVTFPNGVDMKAVFG